MDARSFCIGKVLVFSLFFWRMALRSSLLMKPEFLFSRISNQNNSPLPFGHLKVVIFINIDEALCRKIRFIS
jgi:hypothetical protein